jgi:peptidoglycan hydrolase FlgJ
MDGVQRFLVLSFNRKDAVRVSGRGSPGRMGFPALFFVLAFCVLGVGPAIAQQAQAPRVGNNIPAPQRSRSAIEDRNSPLWQAAQGMEANFLKEMLRNMRKTVQESPEMANSKGYQVFRGMLDDHYAETAAKTQGIGLAEMIVKQVMEMQQQGAQRQPVQMRELNKSDVLRK